jgi:hypothetical protein
MSVYQAKKKNGHTNKRWTAALDLGLDSKGKRKRVVRTAPTKRQATEILRELERTYLGSSETIDIHTTLGDYILSWFELKVRGVLREKTSSSYYYVLSHYIVPALGKKRLIDVNSTAISRRLSALGEEGLSAATRRQIRVVLHKAFNDAVADGKIFKNPVTAVPAPRANESETKSSTHKVFTRTETLKFCQALKGERIEAVCLIAVTMGLRFGEVSYLNPIWRPAQTQGARESPVHSHLNDFDLMDTGAAVAESDRQRLPATFDRKKHCVRSGFNLNHDLWSRPDDAHRGLRCRGVLQTSILIPKHRRTAHCECRSVSIRLVQTRGARRDRLGDRIKLRGHD